MNSADAWYDDEATRNADDLESLLGLSVELVDTMNRAQREVEMEAAKQRHPSGKILTSGPEAVPEGVTLSVLNAADRCDGCSAAALFLLRHDVSEAELALCHHHKAKYGPHMLSWTVIGTNPKLMKELYANRLKGDDHA